MKSKWKVLLSLLTVFGVMSFSTACNFLSSVSQSESSAESNVESNAGTSLEETSSETTASEDSATSEDSTTSEDSATSENTPVTYTVTFVDYNETEISVETYEAGATVVVPNDPVRASDETYTYVFAGWDKEVTAVAGDVTYKATYTETYIDYTVTFLNDDDSVIETKTYHYGDEVTAPTATKADTETYTYVFAGWDKEVTAVAGDVTYKATYTETYIDYVVKFVNDNGGTISENTYHYGDDVVVPDDPSKAENDYFTFAFAGWDSEVAEKVAGSVTYTATFESMLKAGVNGNKVTANAENGVVLGAGEIGDGANYTIGAQEQGFVRQSYLALDGDYALNDYVAFDFTGKNMPEVAFFAKNYNDSMYAEGTTKQGIVVVTGITTWDGQDVVQVNVDKSKGGVINYGFPYMLQDASNGNFCQGAHAESALGRANLVDGTHYRVIMGFTGSGSAITLNWYLYNLDTKAVVEQSSMTTWNFFTGSNAQVGNMTINDLSGSIVLYGKFGATCTLDKIHGVFEDTTLETIATGLNTNATYTVTFKDVNGGVLQTMENVAFGAKVSYDKALPTPDKTEDALFTYSYEWNKPLGKVCGNTEHQLVLVSKAKAGYTANNVTPQGEGIVLAAGGIGDGANYTKGQNNGGYVRQAYLGIDGNYGVDNYVVMDFTGKNMPEIAFFAKNYNDSMYAEGTNKQGIVVVTGITTWEGKLESGVNGNGTQINYGFPYMLQDAANGGFVRNAFKTSNLGRANLVDGKHYRVIMGFEGKNSEGTNGITLHWCLYDLDNNSVVEQDSVETWNFFTGSNAQVGNMKVSDLVGSIVLYGKFGTTCTIDKLYGVENGAFADIVTKYTANN